MTEPDLTVVKYGHLVPACSEGRHYPPHPGDTCDEVDAFITARDQWIVDTLTAQTLYGEALTELMITGEGTGEPLGLLATIPSQPDQPTPAQRALEILRPHLADEPLYRKA